MKREAQREALFSQREAQREVKVLFQRRFFFLSKDKRRKDEREGSTFLKREEQREALFSHREVITFYAFGIFFFTCAVRK